MTDTTQKHEQNVLKHTLAYAIWRGMVDTAEVTRDQLALEALERKAGRLDLEQRRDRVTIDEVEVCYEQAVRRLNRLLPARQQRARGVAPSET